jgi:hypothetical protein
MLRIEPAQGGHDNHEGHSLSPKGIGPKALGSVLCDAWFPQHIQALNNVIRYTTEELLDITAQHAPGEEVVGDVLVPGDWEAVLDICWVAPSNVADLGANIGERGALDWL